MKHFPITCTDNFFKYPDDIRKFALKQDFTPSTGGKFPGERTRELRHLDRDLRARIVKKILSTFFRPEDHYGFHVTLNFQKILPYDFLDKDSALNSGWIHRDTGYDLNGLIYLNPFSHIDAGTSFYRERSENIINSPEHRFNWYKDHENEHSYLKLLKENNAQYEEVMRVGNVYNRLIMYEGQNVAHKESSFWVNDFEPRLTLIFFIRNMEFDVSPLDRTREFDL